MNCYDKVTEREQQVDLRFLCGLSDFKMRGH
jgi:hypothetical protein